MPCPHCKGVGDIGDGDHLCMICGGSGLVTPPPVADDAVERAKAALMWAIAEIEGRTVYRGNDLWSANEQRENSLEEARAALATLSPATGADAIDTGEGRAALEPPAVS